MIQLVKIKRIQVVYQAKQKNNTTASSATTTMRYKEKASIDRMASIAGSMCKAFKEAELPLKSVWSHLSGEDRSKSQLF